MTGSQILLFEELHQATHKPTLFRPDHDIECFIRLFTQAFDTAHGLYKSFDILVPFIPFHFFQ